MNTDSKPSYEFIGRNKTRTLTQNLQPSFFYIDLGKYGLKPTYYTLRHYITKATHHLKYWEFQGSNDGENWICLKKHNDDSSLKGVSKSHTWKLISNKHTNEYYSYFRIWVTGATDYGNWNLTCSGMELYGEWCELKEIKQQQDPEIIKQNELMERSGFDNIHYITFSIYKYQTKDLNININIEHPASLLQTTINNNNIDFEINHENINELKIKLKQLLLNEEYPITYGKQYLLNNMIITIIMIKNIKQLPIGIGWINNHTQFQYDETKNGINCDFIYDDVPTLLIDDIKTDKKDSNKLSGKTQISEQELLKDFIPKCQFKIGPILSLDPDIINQYKNRQYKKQLAIDKYNELKKLKIKMELKSAEKELKLEQDEKKKKHDEKTEYDLKILQIKKEHKFPEWFESLREYAPGYPLQLYAIAWKHNKNEPDQQLARAVNWIFDEGTKFMSSRPKEFDHILAQILPSKIELLLPQQIPDYIVDKTHEFWDPKYATHSMDDINKIHKKKEIELKSLKQKTLKQLELTNQNQSSNSNSNAKKTKENEFNEDEQEQIKALIPKEGKTLLEMKSESTIICPINGIELPPMTEQLKLVQFNKPSTPPPPPFADTKSAKRVVRYSFAALLMHYGVISEAIKCSEFLYKVYSTKKNNMKDNIHPQTPQLTLLSRLWSLCASVRYDMFNELQLKNNNKNNKNKTTELLLNKDKALELMIDKKKMDVRRIVSLLNDDQLKMYLNKLNIDIINKSRYDLIDLVTNIRIKFVVLGKQCYCGSMLVKSVNGDIFNDTQKCALCIKNVEIDKPIFYCPKSDHNNKNHKFKFIICEDCGNQKIRFQLFHLLQNNVKDNDNDDNNDIDPYEIVAERAINKMILLLQLNPLKQDIGVEEEEEEDLEEEEKEEEIKNNDNDNDTIGLLPDIEGPVPPIPSRPRRASIENVDRFTSKKMMAMSSKNIFGTKTQIGGDNKGLKRALSSLYLSGSPDAPTWISRIPENVEEHKTVKMILYLLKKPYSPTMIRDSINGRRIRAKRRAMGLKLFSSLFEHTTSKILHQEVAGLLAAAIKECKLQRILDIEEKKRRTEFKIQETKYLQMNEKEKEEFYKNKSNIEEIIEWNKMKQMNEFEIMWDEPGDFGGDAILHYSRGIEGVGELNTLTKSAFHHLYTVMTNIFYDEFLSQETVKLDAGILGFLDSWSLHFNQQDHSFLHESKIFQVIKVLMSNAYISGAHNNDDDDDDEKDDEKKEEPQQHIQININPERTPKPTAVLPKYNNLNNAGIGSDNEQYLAPANAGLPGHTPEPTPDIHLFQQHHQQQQQQHILLLKEKEEKEEKKEDSPEPQKLLFDDDDSDDDDDISDNNNKEGVMIEQKEQKEEKENKNKLLLTNLLIQKLKDIELKKEEEENKDPLDFVRILQPKNLNKECEIISSTAQHRVPQIIDYNTGTFWQTAVNADNDEFSYNKVKKTHWLQLSFPNGPQSIKEIAWYLDGIRDKEFLPSEVQIFVGNEEKDEEKERIGDSLIPNHFVGWHYFRMSEMKQSKIDKYKPNNKGLITSSFWWLKIPTLHNNGYEMRLRQMMIYGDDEEKNKSLNGDIKLLTSNAKSLTHKRLQDTSLKLFQNLVTRCLLPKKIIDNENENKNNDNDIVSHQLVRLVSSDESELSDLQKMVFQLTINEINKQLEKSEIYEQAFYDIEEESESLNMSIEERRLHQMRLNEIAINDKYVYEMLWTVLQMVESSNKSSMFLAYEKNKIQKLLIVSLLSLLPRSTSRMQDLLFRIYSKVFIHYNDPTIIDNEIIYVSLPDPNKKRKKKKKKHFIFYDVIDYLLFCLASSLSTQYRGLNKNSKKDIKVDGWLPAFENNQVIKCIKFIRQQMNENIGFKQHIKNKLIEYILICKKLTPQYFTNVFKTDIDWKSTNLTYLDYFWLIVGSLCIICGDGTNTLQPLLQLNHEINKNNNDIQIECRLGNISIKILDKLNNNKSKIILTVDLIQCKTIITFKDTQQAKRCRFCQQKLTNKNRVNWIELSNLNNIETELSNIYIELSNVGTMIDVCNDETFCVINATKCSRISLLCGHICNGVYNETNPLPCLEPNCIENKNGFGDKGIDKDTDCAICYTDPLIAMPSILLQCGHCFHFNCCKSMITSKWNGMRITFNFRNCPLCRKTMRHEMLNNINQPIDELYHKVSTKSMMRLKYEKLENHPDIINENSIFYNNPIGFAMKKYAYYLCYKCGDPYYGGEAICLVANGGDNQNFDPSELMCPACSPLLVEDCPKHGKDYIEFKCRYCCQIAVWFCFGTTHFCEACHNNNGKLTKTKKENLVQCPCKPKNRHGLPEKLPDIDNKKQKCPLGISHPPHGEEFCLGCGLCRGKNF